MNIELSFIDVANVSTHPRGLQPFLKGHVTSDRPQGQALLPDPEQDALFLAPEVLEVLLYDRLSLGSVEGLLRLLENAPPLLLRLPDRLLHLLPPALLQVLMLTHALSSSAQIVQLRVSVGPGHEDRLTGRTEP